MFVKCCGPSRLYEFYDNLGEIDTFILLALFHFVISSITSFRMTVLLYLHSSCAFLVVIVYKHFIIALCIVERLFPNSISRHALLSYR